MPVELPVSSEFLAYSIDVALDEELYRFEFAWNERASAWSMNVLTIAQVVLVAGVALRSSWAPLDRYTGRGLPPGRLLVVDTSGEDKDPGRDDLGERVRLLYFTAAEVAARAQG